MPPRNRADRLLPGKALGQDRSLDLRRPIPPPPRTSEHFEAGYPASASIITWHRHSTSALHPIRALRLGAVLQPRKVGSRHRLQITLQIMEVSDGSKSLQHPEVGMAREVPSSQVVIVERRRHR